MWDSGTPFADLVREALKSCTIRELEQRAVDPKSDYRPSRNVLWKLGQGESVKIHPGLVGAVAAAVGRPLHDVQIAAAQQFVGLMAGNPLDDSGDGSLVVAYVPGLTAEDMPRAAELLAQWKSEEA
ncbi:hypothetical protein [Streptomyces sp. NPDC054863]